MATADTELVPWVNLAAASRFLGVGRAGLLALVEAGELTIRKLPGCHPRVRADEVLELARRSTRPARSHALACSGAEA